MNKYVLIACLFASSAFAQGSPWQFTGGILLSEGGDRLFTGKYTDGTKIDITAGGTLALNFGLYRNIGSAFDLQTTLGIHTAGTLGTNGNASFTRFPLEVMGFYQLNDDYRLGAGARKSLSAKLGTSGVATYQPSLEFNASVGSVVELQYLIGKKTRKSKAQTAVNFRYVKETFTEKTEGIKVKGDHIGVGVVFYN
jgi:hypothetical protein